MPQPNYYTGSDARRAVTGSPGGDGNVLGPATHAANYVPQWNNVANSKTLVEGFAIGIADNNLVEIDHASVADNDYAKFTANGLEGRSYVEVRSDLDLFINVRDYGAIPGGSECSAEIQAAITAAGSTGKTVYFPPGIYQIDTTISITAPVGLLGDVLGGVNAWDDAVCPVCLPGQRSGAVIEWIGATNGTVFSFVSVVGCSMRHFLIDCGITGHILHANSTGINITSVQMSKFEDIKIIGMAGGTGWDLNVTGGKNVHMNVFTNLYADWPDIGMSLIGSYANPSNICLNTFNKLTFLYQEGNDSGHNAGIYMEWCDNNSFLGLTYLWRTNGLGAPGNYGTNYGYGLWFSDTDAPGVPDGNYFYHTMALGGVKVEAGATGGNYIPCYDQSNGEPDPTIDAGGKLIYFKTNPHSTNALAEFALAVKGDDFYLDAAVVVTDTLKIGNIVAGTADYNKFLVSDSGYIKYRTDTQILFDLRIEPGGRSVFVGLDAGKNDDLSNNDNVFVGYNSGYTNTTGYGNTFVGKDAGYYNTTGYSNTGIGHFALQANTTGGICNTAVGTDALMFNTSGHNNVAAGFDAMQFNTTGQHNTAIGRDAICYNTDGNCNTGVGAFAIYKGSGDNNVALGFYAGGSPTHSGSNNIFVGYRAGDNVTSGSNNIIIGYDIDAALATASHQLNIGDVITGQVSTGTGIINISQLTLTTDLAIAHGGTGASTAAAACSALSVGTEDSPTFAGLNLTGNLNMGDSDYIKLGAGDDLRIVHDGTSNVIYCYNGVILYIQNGTNSEHMAIFRPNHRVDLFYDGALKFVTSNTGISVTGCVVDTTCEIFTEDAIGIIKDISSKGTGNFDEYNHERFDMKRLYKKYPYLIQKEKNEDGKIAYYDRLGAKSDLLYRAIMQLNERVELLGG